MMTTKGKILIVDDDPDFVKTTEMILSAEGYEVITAGDGKKGLEKVQEAQPDLLLIDLRMESLFEGFSFMATLRTAPEYAQLSSTPVIMVSSVKKDTGSRFTFDDPEDMGDLSEPDAYMDKPVNPEDLLEKVAALIERGKSRE